MAVPTRGQFTLHARAVPPLKAGDYNLTGMQTLAGGDVAPYDGHLRVTSPRYAMPPDQILSTFPPANAEGSFEHRLPQIVLKRRTLPWDRRAWRRRARLDAVAGVGGDRGRRGPAFR